MDLKVVINLFLGGKKFGISFRDSPWVFTPPKCTSATPLSPVKTPRQFISTVNHFLGFLASYRPSPRVWGTVNGTQTGIL